MRRALRIALGVIGVLAVLIVAAFGFLQTGYAKRQILALLENEVSDPPARLQAKALEGFIPFEMQLVDVSLSDQQGVWLEADRIALDWSPAALLGKTLRIDNLSAGKIVVARAPVSPPSQGESTPPKFPQLPVNIDLQRLQVDRIELGAAFLGEPAVFSLGAQAKLGDPARGLQAALDLKRLDRDNDTLHLEADYRPDADTLKVDAQAAEPQGGLITKLLGLPARPSFTLTLAGEGPLDHWQAKGTAQADNHPVLHIDATSTGAASDRTVAFDVTLPNLPMLPTEIAPLVAGGIVANGNLHLAGSSGPIRIEALKLQTAAGALAVSGTFDPAGPLDLTGHVHLAQSGVFQPLLPPDLAWTAIDADLQVGGTTRAPKVSVDGTADNLAYAGNQLPKTTVSLAATLHPDAMRADGVTASVGADTVVLADPSLQPLVTSGMRVDFAGALDEKGTITADQLAVQAGDVSATLQGAATEWGGGDAQLEGAVNGADLSPALALAGLKGGGAIAASVKLDKKGEVLSADLDARLSKASIGIAQVDALLSPETQVKLNLHRDAEGALTLDTATVESASAHVAASGTMSAAEELDLKADLALKDVAKLLPGGSGNVTGTVHLLGPLADPRADLALTSGTVRYDRYTLANLKATVGAQTLISGPEARVGLAAALNDLPLTAGLNVKVAQSRVALSAVKLQLGKTNASGSATIGAGIDGALTFASPDLGEIGRLFDQQLGGSAEGTAELHNPKGKQSAAINAKLASIEASGVKVTAATLDAKGDDLLGKDPAIAATLAASGITAANQSVDKLNAKLAGTMSALTVTADAQGPTATVTTAATIHAKPGETAITLSKLDLTANKVEAKLLNPAEIILHGEETRVANLAIGARGGALRLDAALTAAGNQATLKLEKLPLSVLDAANADLHFLGTLDGTLALTGTKQAPNATLDLKGSGLGVSGASEQLADLSVKSTWSSGTLQTNGRLELSKSSALDFNATLPVAGDPASGLPVFNTAAALDARAQGKLDLALANAFIPGGADHVAGMATVDLAAKGPLGDPALSGSAKIADGAYVNQRYGTRLRDLTVELVGEGSKLRVVSLSAKTPDGGALSGSGAVDFGGAQDVDIEVTMTHARMINAPIGTAITDGKLAFKGALTKQVDLTGTVKIVKAEIHVPDKLPVEVDEIPVVEVNASPERQAELAALDKPPPKSMRIGLDITVDAPEQVFVRGRGLDAELGGKLKITGTADQPVIDGDLKLRRGDFNLLSRRLEFQQGKVSFSGGKDINPLLDFTATSKLQEADVTVTVGGTATNPTIGLHSSPELPQDEILAQLLFGKASGSLSPFEAVQLAQAAASLTGVGVGGGQQLDKFRKTLGLDRLDIQSGEGDAGPSLSAGRYVTRNVFVGAKQGTDAKSSAATVEIEVTPNVKVETDIGADASGKLGVNWEWNY